MFAWLLILYLSGGERPPFQVEPFVVKTIQGIDIPTDIHFAEGRYFLTAGVLDPKPGIYGLHPAEGDALRAGLLQILPRQDIQGISTGSEDQFLLASMRHFTVNPEDWESEVVTVDSLQYRPLSFQQSNVPSRCGNGRFECGLTEVLYLEPERLIAVSLQRPARLFLLSLIDGKWTGGRGIPIMHQGRYTMVSAMERKGDKLVLLLKDRWSLVTLDLVQALDPTVSTFDTALFFDFSSIAKRFRAGPPRFVMEGLADGFAIGARGELAVILNNQGYTFQKSPDGVLNERPKLLIFPPQTSPPEKVLPAQDKG